MLVGWEGVTGATTGASESFDVDVMPTLDEDDDGVNDVDDDDVDVDERVPFVVRLPLLVDCFCCSCC